MSLQSELPRLEQKLVEDVGSVKGCYEFSLNTNEDGVVLDLFGVDEHSGIFLYKRDIFPENSKQGKLYFFLLGFLQSYGLLYRE